MLGDAFQITDRMQTIFFFFAQFGTLKNRDLSL
jgi:hypothetical protein